MRPLTDPVAVCILGFTKVGKSSMVKRFILGGRYVHDTVNRTNIVTNAYVNNVQTSAGQLTIRIVDVPGHFSVASEMQEQVQDGAHAVIVCFDALSSKALKKAEEEFWATLKTLDTDCIAVACVTKVDGDGGREITNVVEAGEEWARKNHIRLFRTSALHGHGVNELFGAVVETVLQERRRVAGLPPPPRPSEPVEVNERQMQGATAPSAITKQRSSKGWFSALTGCFPGDARVDVLGRGTCALKDVSVGELVLTRGGTYEPVLLFSRHWASRRSGEWRRDDNHQSLACVEVEIADGRVLRASPNHLLLAFGTSAAGRGSGRLIPSGRIRAGLHELLVPDKDDATNTQYASVTRVRDGILCMGAYSPITRSCTIVVDGVVASCLVDAPWTFVLASVYPVLVGPLVVLQQLLPHGTYAALASVVDWVLALLLLVTTGV